MQIQQLVSASFCILNSLGGTRFACIGKLCLLTLSLVTPQVPVLATTYFVEKTGSDANPGTEAQPWLTIQRAADAMVAGDSVVVGDGVYAERVVTRANGTIENPITFRAVSWSAIVGAFAISHAHQIVAGFTLSGRTAKLYQGSVTAFSGANHLTVVSNVFAGSPPGVCQLIVYHIPPPATNLLATHNQFLTPQFISVILRGLGPNTLSDNFFTSTNGWDAVYALASNTRISGNTFTNWSNLTTNANHLDLIQAFSSNGEIATNVVVENNLAVNCTNCQIGHIENQAYVLHNGGNIADWSWRNNLFVNVDWVMSIYAEHFRFYNNIFLRSGRNTAGPLLFRTSDDRGNGNYGRLYNNMFVECGSKPDSPELGWYHEIGAPLDLRADYNLVIGTGAGTAKTTFTEPHGLNGIAPIFVNMYATGADGFRLQAVSPCIGAGTNLSDLFTTDFAGTTRGESWDIGPFAFRPPSRPKGLRILDLGP